MIRLTLAVAFLSVFGFVAWAIVTKLLKDDKKTSDNNNNSN